MEKGYWNAKHFVCQKCRAPFNAYYKIHDDGKVGPVYSPTHNEQFCVHCFSLKNSIAQAKLRKWQNEERKRFAEEEKKRIEKEAAARRFKAAAGVKEPEDEIPF